MHWQLGQTVEGINARQSLEKSAHPAAGWAGLAGVPALPPAAALPKPTQDMTAWPGSEGGEQLRQGAHSRSHPQPGSVTDPRGACSKGSSPCPFTRRPWAPGLEDTWLRERSGQTWQVPHGAHGERRCNGGNEAQSEAGAGAARPSPELWERPSGSMRLMPLRSPAGFGEDHRSQRGTFDLALEGQRGADPSDKEEEGTPGGEDCVG